MPMDPNDYVTEPYTRKAGKGLTYLIEANRHGRWGVKLDGKVIKTGGLPDYYGKPRWGSKKLQADAFAAARSAIENLMTDEG
jgi:hypothetical protein